MAPRSKSGSRWSGALYRRVALREIDAVRTLSPLARDLWREARMGPQSARHGVSRFSIAMAGEDLGAPLEDVRAALAELVEQLGWTWDGRWLFVPHALAVSIDGSEAQVTGLAREVELLAPPPEILRAFTLAAEELKASTTVSTTRSTPGTTGGTTPHTTGGQNKNKNSNSNTNTNENAQANVLLPARVPSLIRPRDLNAFLQGPIFSIPQRWADKVLAASNGHLTEAQLTAFAQDLFTRVEAQRIDVAGQPNFLGWLDEELRAWRGVKAAAAPYVPTKAERDHEARWAAIEAMKAERHV